MNGEQKPRYEPQGAGAKRIATAVSLWIGLTVTALVLVSTTIDAGYRAMGWDYGTPTTQERTKTP